jgi:hypothetical protein
VIVVHDLAFLAEGATPSKHARHAVAQDCIAGHLCPRRINTDGWARFQGMCAAAPQSAATGGKARAGFGQVGRASDCTPASTPTAISHRVRERIRAPARFHPSSTPSKGNQMDEIPFLAIMAFGTMLAVVIFAMVNIKKTEDRRHSNTKKSTLAADAPNKTAPGEKPVDT